MFIIYGGSNTIDLGAKWSKQLYEEAREEIANVAIPHETIKTLIAAKTPTPNLTQYEAKLAVPEIVGSRPIASALTKVVSNPLKAFDLTALGSLLFGTRQEKATTAAKFLPLTIKETTTEAPEFTPAITYEKVDLGKFIVNVPTTKYNTAAGTEVIQTDQGKFFTSTPADYPTNVVEKTPSESLNDMINALKDTNKPLYDWYQETTLGATNITLPDWPSFEFPDILGGLAEAGKWLLIGIAALAGVYLAGSYFKGRNK